MAQAMQATASLAEEKKIWGVITASSVGTLIEWYDFYIFGSLAAAGIIGKVFFPSDNPTAAFLNSLATFAAGFVVRPFGALVFGRLGDLIGRKYTFLVTLVLMGGSTFLIGCIPGYESIGALAPTLVLLLRFLQGLALGGEYGGAATYVAEHSPAHKRGFYTSFIQTTATLGLLLSIGVIMIVRFSFGKEAFNDWAWRVPFLVSIFLIIVSVFIRMRMEESPLFAKLKSSGKVSTNPLKESFAYKANLKMVLLALFGAAAGQGVVWYTGQYYALTFMSKTCGIDSDQSNTLLMVAIIFVTPLFVFFGSLSDRIGRKYIILAGMLCAVLLYRPIYQQMYNITNIKTKQELADQTKVDEKAEKKGDDEVKVTKTSKVFSDGTKYTETKTVTTYADASKKPKEEVAKSLVMNGGDFWQMTFLVFVQILFVTMAYGPIAAFLVEIFPTKIRYTSMSLPYHVGNGIFGGLTPYIATRIVEASKGGGSETYYMDGLWYPIAVAAICFVIGLVFLNNKRDKDVTD
jgi:MFS family permease